MIRTVAAVGPASVLVAARGGRGPGGGGQAGGGFGPGRS